MNLNSSLPVHRPWLPYVVPMALYMGLMLAESPANVAWFYPVKVAAVAVAVWYFRRSYVELWHSPHPNPLPQGARGLQTGLLSPPGERSGEGASREKAATMLLAVLVGLVAIAIWIGIEPYYPKLGELKPFDPTTIATPVWRWAFIGFRVFGAVVVVAFMEELFWRGFFIRWLVNEDFKSVPVGTITGLSFAVTVALFGVEHRDWLAGLICGALYNWLYYRTKSLWACVVAHAVSNAALAGWVLATGDWKFW